MDTLLMGSKSVTTPGLKPTFEQACHSSLLPPEKHRAFRAIAARANYLAMDRPDVQYAAKEICRWMAAPTEASVVALKRLGRYLQGAHASSPGILGSLLKRWMPTVIRIGQGVQRHESPQMEVAS